MAEKASPKTLVVGSSGHSHVTCVAWGDLQSVNLKDFDVVVVNVVSLDDTTILKDSPHNGILVGARTELSRLLQSGGKIIALTPGRKIIKQKDSWRSNMEWSPFEIGSEVEQGDTIKIKIPMFQRYLSRLKRWGFYFFVPKDALSTELVRVFGPTYEVSYQLPASSYAVNRYGKMLAGEVALVASYSKSAPGNYYGSIAVLPYIPELEQKEALNLILEELIGQPQQSLPPDWIGQIQMPFVADINAKIAEKNDSIDALTREIAEHQRKRAEIEKWRKLVYATGPELEQIFEEAVSLLGAKVKPANTEEEFIIEHRGSAGIVECKGVSKSISLDHLRQVVTHVLQEDQTAGKGILFGNAWRNSPLDDRGKSGTPIFPDNVIKRANQLEIALVGSVEFLGAFSRFLKSEISGDAILDAIMAQSGVVDFGKIK